MAAFKHLIASFSSIKEEKEEKLESGQLEHRNEFVWSRIVVKPMKNQIENVRKMFGEHDGNLKRNSENVGGNFEEILKSWLKNLEN